MARRKAAAKKKETTVEALVVGTDPLSQYPKQLIAINLGVTELGLIRFAMLRPSDDGEDEEIEVMIDVGVADATAIRDGLNELIPVAEHVNASPGGFLFVHQSSRA